MQTSLNQKELYIQYFEELKSRIIQKKLNRATPIHGSIGIAIVMALYVVGLVFLQNMWPIWSVLYFFVLTVELGFISHDILHHQYFRNPKVSAWVASVTANLLIWISHSWWTEKHNVGHHTFTNSDIHDTDIRDYDEIFTWNSWKFPIFHRYKRLLFWCVTPLVYPNLIIRSWIHILEQRKYGEMLFSIGYICILPTAFILAFGFFHGILCFIVLTFLVWMHLAFVFMVNHIWMEIIDGKKVREYAWIDLQTRTSRNILGGECIHQIFGWLNKQIEHHLFPRVSRYRIRAVSLEVKKFAKEKWLPYHEVTFREAIREIYNTLRTGKTL